MQEARGGRHVKAEGVRKSREGYYGGELPRACRRLCRWPGSLRDCRQDAKTLPRSWLLRIERGWPRPCARKSGHTPIVQLRWRERLHRRLICSSIFTGFPLVRAGRVLALMRPRTNTLCACQPSRFPCEACSVSSRVGVSTVAGPPLSGWPRRSTPPRGCVCGVGHIKGRYDG